MQIAILYERHCGERIKRLHGPIRHLVSISYADLMFVLICRLMNISRILFDCHMAAG